MATRDQRHTVLMYVTAAAAVVLLAPYAGCHILTSDPGATQPDVRREADSRTKRNENATSARSTGTKKTPLTDLEEILK